MSSGVAIALGLVVSLAAAAFFAACEGSLLARGTSTDERTSGGGAATRRDESLSNAAAFGHLLSVVWFGALVWAAAATGFGTRPVEALPWWGWLPVLVAAAFVVHAVGEQVPRAIVTDAPRAWAGRTTPLLSIWRAIVTPIVAPVGVLARMAGRFAGSPTVDTEPFTSREMQSIVDETSARAALEAEERQMITSIFAFGETTAREVMTPRTDIVALEVEIPIADAISRVRSAEHSRVPVYRESLDAVVGILYAKDLLSIAHGHVSPPASLNSLLREATFIPEAKKIDDLLREFQRQRIHMAVVIDEYGGTAGIVTLEDILEELVGEIQDEYDRERPLVVPLADGTLQVDGRLDADDFNELTGATLEGEGGVETLGGLVAREVGRMPEGGETVRLGGWNFRVEAVAGKRVTVLKAWSESSREEDE